MIFSSNVPRRVAELLAVLVFSSMLGACSSIKNTIREVMPEKEKIDYKKAQTADSLEIPPDLTKGTEDAGLAVPDIDPSGTATFSDYSRERAGGVRVARNTGVLPKQDNIRLERDGNTRWLVLQGTPAQAWPVMRDFWLQNGFLIKREDPRIGILETEWAENRADIPKDFISRTISKIGLGGLYSAATRDKFRIRLEHGIEPGTTELYLTHRGAEEVIEDASGESTTSIWRPRPTDPELEIEMLRRLAVAFGVEERQSRQLAKQDKQQRIVRARLSRGDGMPTLNLNDGFARAWRRTGVALDRVGFTVEDRDRSRGVYYVRYIDPLIDSNEEKGWLDKFKFWGNDSKPTSDKFQVSLSDDGQNRTRVIVLNEQGKPEKSKTADRILGLLHEQLK